MQTTHNHCVFVMGGSYKINGTTMIMANMNATQMP